MSRPLNFLHFTTFYPPHSFGGDAIYLYRLCHALGDAGHHVDVVHCVDSYHLLHPGEPPVEFAPHPNVITHPLRSSLGLLSPVATHQTGRPWLKRGRIRDVLDSRPYDVIHFHNMSLLGPATMALEPVRGPAVKMYTTHEHWLICPMHVLWKFNKRPCEKPDCLRCVVRGRRPPQLWRYTGMLESAGRHVDQFVSPSRFTADMHAQRGFPYPLGVLPYFIPRADSDWRLPAPRPQARPYFLFVGRLETIKGLHTLIELWKQVEDYDLLVAGGGAQERELRAQAASNPRIRFLGTLAQKDLGALYHHALACLVPSLTYETFGIICIEAFARKTPVIARDLGALPEVIRESGGGLVYHTDAELLEAMRAIADSPQRRAELGARGYETFERRWTVGPHLEMYFDYLRQAALRKFKRIPWEEERSGDPAHAGARSNDHIQCQPT